MVVNWFRLRVHKYYFSSQGFKFLGFSIGDFVLSQMIPVFFPSHLPREFKIKWWSNFSSSTTQQIPHIRQWISSKNSPSKPSSSKVSIHIPPDAILLFQISFPSNKEFKRHLKLLKKKALETLFQFSDSGIDEDLASSVFLGDVDEDMCYRLPYTPLGECIQASFKVSLCYPSKAITWNSCQTSNQQSCL